jgi:heme A synthase
VLVYFLTLFILCYFILTKAKETLPEQQRFNVEVLTGSVVAIQLFVGSNESMLNVQDISMRLIQLTLALLVMITVNFLISKKPS